MNMGRSSFHRYGGPWYTHGGGWEGVDHDGRMKYKISF